MKTLRIKVTKETLYIIRLYYQYSAYIIYGRRGAAKQLLTVNLMVVGLIFPRGNELFSLPDLQW